MAKAPQTSTAGETERRPEMTPNGSPAPDTAVPSTATLAQTRALQLLDRLIDQQLETREISSETLATLRPLTSLLDLLARPQDQSTELGRQLAESLSQLAFSASETGHQVKDLRAEIRSMTAVLDGLTKAVAQLQDGQKKLATTLSRLDQKLAQLNRDLFEDAPASQNS